MAAHQPTQTTPENWKPVVGYEGLYEVSDHGNVRSVDRVTPHGHSLRGKIKKQVPDEQGRPRVFLHQENKSRTRRVCHLVLEAFVGPRLEGMEACHWDDNCTNNHVENLRWGSRSENQVDRVRNGLNFNSNKTHCPMGHPLVQPNLVRSALPGRTCKACNRAKASLHRHPERDYQKESDRYYRVIILESCASHAET